MTPAYATAYAALIAGTDRLHRLPSVVLRGFRKSKAEMATFGGAQLGEVQLVGEHVFKDQEEGIVWKASAGLVFSGVVLWLITLIRPFGTPFHFWASGHRQL